MTDIGASLIRTVVPLIVGAIVAFLTSHNIDTSGNEEFISQLVGALVAFLYYAAARVLETRVKPKFGWLLGKPAAPTYPGKTVDTPVDTAYQE